MSSPLRHALLDYPEPAYKVAMQMCISEVRLSKISSGLIEPRPEERIKLAAILDRKEAELFPKQLQTEANKNEIK